MCNILNIFIKVPFVYDFRKIFIRHDVWYQLFTNCTRDLCVVWVQIKCCASYCICILHVLGLSKDSRDTPLQHVHIPTVHSLLMQLTDLYRHPSVRGHPREPMSLGGSLGVDLWVRHEMTLAKVLFPHWLGQLPPPMFVLKLQLFLHHKLQMFHFHLQGDADVARKVKTF